MSRVSVFRALADGDLATALEQADCTADAFRSAVQSLTGEDVNSCSDCAAPMWGEDATEIGGDSCYCVCESCRSESYSFCESCDEWIGDDDMCVVGDTHMCESCRANDYTYCNECEEWFPDDDGHSHDEEGCDCQSPLISFQFPNDGYGTIGNDEILRVEMPAGVIADVGINAINRLVSMAMYDAGWRDAYVKVPAILDSIGPEWQKKDGNFTRRLARALYKHGQHLANEVLSEVGNIARAHSSDGTDWYVSLTRDLNLPAEDFYHGDSCWWGSYAYSRCALKQWGGLGMRTWSDENGGCVTGRAWVQPLNTDMYPTHRTVGVPAYVIYNGYGALEGYTPARIIAHLTGKTYRKVSVELAPQYVNNSAGYLVADQSTCDAVSQVNVTGDQHDSMDATEVARSLKGCAA